MPEPSAANERGESFLTFVQQQAAALRNEDEPPKTLPQWEQQKQALRRHLLNSWGQMPKEDCPLQPRVLGQLQRDGYRVEKVVLQTRPGILMTANAYVPEGSEQRAAVLCVHGHWRGAKQDPTVQARCIGLAKLGFFVLVVDAFGAGERGLGKALGEYHGEMVAATLWPAGLMLAGLQVYENMRAVDYLQSRPEVDPQRIGITGASGGGNQTMYAGAFDQRFRCVVPTCSVGTYQAYLGAACCMCELVPAALTYAEEWALLAMVAPRALMVINATQDAFQFSVGQARKSVAGAKTVFQLYGKPELLRHAIFESKHDYNQPMREAMYGWMSLHLKGEGDGQPIAEPTIKVEDPEVLRCFPGSTRPDDFVTIPQFAAAAGSTILATRTPPVHAQHWEAERMWMGEALPRAVGHTHAETVPIRPALSIVEDGRSRSIRFPVEGGLSLSARQEFAKRRRRRRTILLDLDGAEQAGASDLAQPLRLSDRDLVTIDLRATGASAQQGDRIGGAPDHNTAQWSMWIGRPLLGQWLRDVSRLLDALETVEGADATDTAIVGVGPAAIVALLAAAMDPRLSRVAAVHMLASFVSDQPYQGQRLGLLVPGILRDVGDIPQLAALVAPRPLLLAGGVTGSGKPLAIEALRAQFQYTRRVYQLHRAADRLRLTASESAGEVARHFESS